MEQLNFPFYEFRLRKDQIFDPARKKFVALTPEEWVRQHVIRFLLESGGYPLSLMGVEVPIELNTLKKRVDILVHGRDGRPLLIVECKAPSVHITQATFDQAARYNLKAGASYFLLSNGHKHYCCKVGGVGEPYVFLKSLPAFSEIEFI